jgi:hypothetical protein
MVVDLPAASFSHDLAVAALPFSYGCLLSEPPISSFHLMSSCSCLAQGSADTPVRPNQPGGAAAKNHDAEKNLRAPVKSRAPLLFGLITGAVVIAAGAFFALKKPAESGPLSALSVVPSAVEASKPVEGLWQPLVPEAVWQKSMPKREFASGLLHVTGTPIYTGLPGTNPADGAVRATMKLLPQTRNPSVHGRWSGTSGYQLQLRGEIGTMSAQIFFVRGKDSGSLPLAVRKLSKQPVAGESVTLELRIQGDLLTGLVNGETCIEAKDKTRPSSGEWGIYASDAWFESAEVQSIPASAAREPTMVKLWDAPDKLPNKEGVRWENGVVRLDKASINYDAQKSRDAILRASVLMSEENAGGVQLVARHNTGKPFYSLGVNGRGGSKNGSIELRVFGLNGLSENNAATANSYQTLASWPLPKIYQPDDWARLELRCIGDQLTVTVDGVHLGTVKVAHIKETGGVGIGVMRTGYFRNIEYVPLDKDAPLAPSQPARPEWRKLPPPDAAFLKLSGASINEAEEWITPKGLTLWQVMGRNIAIRGELKGIRGNTAPPQISARRVKADNASAANPLVTSRALILHPTAVLLQFNRIKPGSQTEMDYVPLSRSKLAAGVDVDRDWVPFEYALVGNASLAKVAGISLPIGQSPEGQDTGDIQLNGGQFRHLEYIDLDGVSEPEALKLLGFVPASPTLPLSKSSPPSPPPSSCGTHLIGFRQAKASHGKMVRCGLARSQRPTTHPRAAAVPFYARPSASALVRKEPRSTFAKARACQQTTVVTTRWTCHRSSA